MGKDTKEQSPGWQGHCWGWGSGHVEGETRSGPGCFLVSNFMTKSLAPMPAGDRAGVGTAGDIVKQVSSTPHLLAVHDCPGLSHPGPPEPVVIVPSLRHWLPTQGLLLFRFCSRFPMFLFLSKLPLFVHAYVCPWSLPFLSY